jgi:hypothetical protein
VKLKSSHKKVHNFYIQDGNIDQTVEFHTEMFIKRRGVGNPTHLSCIEEFEETSARRKQSYQANNRGR